MYARSPGKIGSQNSSVKETSSTKHLRVTEAVKISRKPNYTKFSAKLPPTRCQRAAKSRSKKTPSFSKFPANFPAERRQIRPPSFSKFTANFPTEKVSKRAAKSSFKKVAKLYTKFPANFPPTGCQKAATSRSKRKPKYPKFPANFPAETVSNGRQISLRKDAKLFEIPREFPTDKVSKGHQISLLKEAKLHEIPREFPTDEVSKRPPNLAPKGRYTTRNSPRISTEPNVVAQYSHGKVKDETRLQPAATLHAFKSGLAHTPEEGKGWHDPEIMHYF